MIVFRLVSKTLNALSAAALAGVFAGTFLVSIAHAELSATITDANRAPIPVAIPLFLGDDPQMAGEISNVVQADLERSGLFQPLDRASFLEQIRDVNAAPRFPDWRTIRADALVVGRISKGGDGKVGDE